MLTILSISFAGAAAHHLPIALGVVIVISFLTLAVYLFGELRTAWYKHSTFPTQQSRLTLVYARHMDAIDPLRKYRKLFFFPRMDFRHGWKKKIYLCGNSLGLMPKAVVFYVLQVLWQWARLGVEGHWKGKYPWMPYHENVTNSLAKLVGAEPIEVVAMNTLSANIHLMLASFYQPQAGRFKILVGAGEFPSDTYAIASHLRQRGIDSEKAIIRLEPRQGEHTLRTEDILDTIKQQGHEIALIFLGSVNFRTGQAFYVDAITKAGHEAGCMVGWDMAHDVGNRVLKLHEWNVDFAIWCHYKYINSGPGAIAGCFVHACHANSNLPRLAGWWGHNKDTRFKMSPNFDPIPGAEGWQLSNPPILSFAGLMASLKIFDRVGMKVLRAKSEMLTRYLEYLAYVELPEDFCTIITPHDLQERGCQISLEIYGDLTAVMQQLEKVGIICDERQPNILRISPVPLYNSFEDVFHCVQALKRFSQHSQHAK